MDALWRYTFSKVFYRNTNYLHLSCIHYFNNQASIVELKRSTKLPLTNRFTSMIENTSTHNLHSSLVLNESIWWCRFMSFLCSLYWRKMRQKVKCSPEYRFTVMVQRKTTKFEKENFELSVFLYANSHPKTNILLPCNALQYYYSL